MSTILLMNFHVACLPLSKPGEPFNVIYEML